MSGAKVNDYAIGDSNIQSVMLTLDKAYKGLHQVSLTNYDTTAESQIAAGSVVECGGALFKFDSNESITGSPSDGTVYIRLVPAGDTITAEYTNTAPTWSDSKQGWYGTGADVNKRYIEFVMFLDSTLWKIKENLKINSGNDINESILYYADGSQTIGVAPAQTVKFQTKIYDFSGQGNFNVSTGVYTVPKNGVYLIHYRLSALSGDGGLISFTAGLHTAIVSNLSNFFTSSETLFLYKGDEIEFKAYSNSGTYTISSLYFLGIKKIR